MRTLNLIDRIRLVRICLLWGNECSAVAIRTKISGQATVAAPLAVRAKCFGNIVLVKLCCLLFSDETGTMTKWAVRSTETNHTSSVASRAVDLID